MSMCGNTRPKDDIEVNDSEWNALMVTLFYCERSQEREIEGAIKVCNERKKEIYERERERANNTRG